MARTTTTKAADAALYRIKNSASVGAEAPVAPKIRYTKPDLTSATDTFAALARMCGVTSNVQDASLDFGASRWPSEQLYNDNVALEEGQLQELEEGTRRSDDDPVSLRWGPFHAAYMKRERHSFGSTNASVPKTKGER